MGQIEGSDPQTRHLVLGSGRRVGYAEIGDPHGIALVYCHGILGSRLESLLLDRLGRELGLRIISLDRPGYGLSSPAPHHRVVDWVPDLLELMDALELERVLLVGVSGGGPYALATAWAAPERVVSLTLVASLAPIGEGLPLRSLPHSARWLFESARHAPWLLDLWLMPLAALLRHRSLETFAWLTRSTPRVDQAAIASPDLQALFARCIPEGVRQGPRGVLEDFVLLSRDWGFSVADVAVDAQLWHGELDRTVPVIAGRYLAGQLSRCRAHFLRGAGHFSLPAAQARVILETLLHSVAPEEREARSASPSPPPHR